MTPSQILLTVKACILLALLGLAYYLGGASARVDLAQYKAGVAERTAKVADLATKASELARKAEQAHSAAVASIAQQYEVEKGEIETRANSLVADLRADRQRLHQRWQAALATSELSRAAKSASELDAAEQDRIGSATRIIAAADRCDAQVEGLQRVIRADRR